MLTKGFEYERFLMYPLAGATGYDTDDTLILLRAIEMHENEIANDEFMQNDRLKFNSWHIQHVYREYCSTTLNLWEVDSFIILVALDIAMIRGENYARLKSD